ncbi:MAG: nucleoside 2-deoxyribosyltransferase [Anaerolineae bacterium]|nr:nucleoside 2-deoxyribosyltransferase [Anaerolineae bacterium]
MKVYCAGPLFTLCEREYMSRCGQALRDAGGIEPFVPHENIKLRLPVNTADRLLALGVATPETLAEQSLEDLVRRLLQTRTITREDLNLPPGTEAKQVFERDVEAIVTADAVLAVINGPEVDDGTACEIGIFAALMEIDPTKKGVVAIHDDWRTLDWPGEGKGLNPFVHGCLLKSGVIVRRLENAIAILESWRDGKGARA